MGGSSYPFFLRLGNIIYRKFYTVYKPLYFLYKRSREKQEIAFFKKVVRKNMTVVDIGGNIGFYAALFSNLVGDSGSVHVFEPDPLNFQHLASNVSGMKNVIINNCAVGAESKTIRLYHSDELNVDHQTYDNGENRVYTEVQCIALDDYFAKREMVDFIKIDIQGYDYFALKGMTETIKRSPGIKIFGEFWPYGLSKAGTDPAEYLRLLTEAGFEIELQAGEQGLDFPGKVHDKFFYTNFYGEKCLKR